MNFLKTAVRVLGTFHTQQKIRNNGQPSWQSHDHDQLTKLLKLSYVIFLTLQFLMKIRLVNLCH